MFGELRLLLPYLRRYRWLYLPGALAILVSVALRLLIPGFIGDAFDELRALFTSREESAGGEGATLVGALTSDEGRGVILRTALAMVLTASAMALVRTASRLLVLGTSRRAIHDLRDSLFDKLLRLAPSYYVGHSTGHIMSRSVNDVTYVQSLLGPVFMYLAETGVQYTFCLVAMLSISPSLTAVSVLPFPFFIYLARRQAAKIQRDSRAAQDKLGEISAKVDESLSGQAVIQTLTLEDFDLERFSERCDEYRRLNLQVTRARGMLLPMMVALASLSTFLVLWVGGPQVVRGEMSLGGFIKFILYMAFMSAPTGVLGFVISSLQRGKAALGRLREVLEAEETLSDPLEPVPDPIHSGAIRVRDLSLRYPAQNGAGQRTVIDRLSFEIPAGSTLGVVGRTGSGKSTLVAALARQLEVEEGKIFIDDVDVTRMRADDLRANVGCVPQETFLFSASLADNVALGDPGASRERIEEAVRVARLDQDLVQLPEGLDTRVGERGLNLSGGQRQRAALARAILLEPRILILDDTLSAVDADTAEAILEGLRPIMKGRTTIIVAHRISAVQHADKILVLEDGRLLEEGDHAQLLELGGFYARLFEQQSLRASLAAELDVEVDAVPPEGGEEL